MHCNIDQSGLILSLFIQNSKQGSTSLENEYMKKTKSNP